MTTLEFVPFERVGKISFNDSPYDVEKKIGKPTRESKPHKSRDSYIFDYDQAGISINYTSDFKSIYSIGGSDIHNIQFMFSDINLSKQNVIRTMSEISRLGYSWAKDEENYYISIELGLMLILYEDDLSCLSFLPKFHADQFLGDDYLTPFYPPYIDLYKQEYLF